MSNGVYPCHVSAYKNFMPLTFDGGVSSLCKSLFAPGDFISRPWNGCILVQKTQATQSVDHACIFRVMSGNSRLTLTIRTSGDVCLRLYKAGGSVQRECETTSIPTTGNVMHIGYSWDGNRLALSVYDTTAKALVQVVESTTNISSLPAWTEADGIYVGNRADLSLPYKGNIYGGTFGYGVALSGASMAREADAGNMAFGTQFVIHPQVMGYRGTGIIRGPNHHDITVLNPDKVAFWNLNAPSNVIQEWWRFFPSIDAIPPGVVVLDSDGVMKQKVGDFLIPVPVTIIGSGPPGQLPADASGYWRKGLWVYNGVPYVSVRSFHNEGVDFGNWGRPSWLSDIAPNKSWTISGSLNTKKSAAVAQYIMSLASGDAAAAQQLAIVFLQSTDIVSLRVGGVDKTARYTLPASSTNIEYKITSNGTTTDLWINRVKIITELVNGPYVEASSDFRFFGFSVNTLYNAEANFYVNTVRNGFSSTWENNGQVLDCFNANNLIQWDGGATATSCAGNPIAFTDGTPLGRAAFSWVSLADAQAWGVL